MTGQELIDSIVKHNLQNETIIPFDLFNGIDGEYLRFSCSDFNADYKVLWLTDDYLQDVIFNHAGDLTYGEFSKAEAEIYIPQTKDTSCAYQL